MNVVWCLVYRWGLGICYATFTALVLDAIVNGAAATTYTIYASLSNFPLWWLGLALGGVADVHGPATMLVAEALIALAGVTVFAVVARVLRVRAPAA